MLRIASSIKKRLSSATLPIVILIAACIVCLFIFVRTVGPWIRSASLAEDRGEAELSAIYGLGIDDVRKVQVEVAFYRDSQPAVEIVNEEALSSFLECMRGLEDRPFNSDTRNKKTIRNYYLTIKAVSGQEYAFRAYIYVDPEEPVQINGVGRQVMPDWRLYTKQSRNFREWFDAEGLL